MPDVDHGEAATPPTGPPAAPTTAGVATDQVEAAARAFLAGYWAPPAGITYGQLADQLAPVAMDTVLGPYRSRADEPVSSGEPVTVTTVTVTRSDGSTGVASARGTRPDGAVVWRTLTLTVDELGAWKVAGVQ